MRNLIYFIAILTFLCVGCINHSAIDSTQDEIDFKAAYNFFAQGLMKTETDVSLTDFRTKSEQFISFLHELATEIMTMEDGESVVFRLYFENEKAVIVVIDYDSAEPDSGAINCEGWDDCKTCSSEDCFAKFMADKLAEYGDCSEFRVERGTISAKVYARPF